MIIPGLLITLLTFPGVIVHELAHQFFCRLLHVPVFKVCYFQPGKNPAGYVIHETPASPWAHLLIGIGPFFVNSTLGVLVAAGSAAKAFDFNAADGLDAFLIWLGVSIAMHAFPSTGDAKAILARTKSEKSVLFRGVALPMVSLIYLGALGSFFWLNLIYGIGVIAFVYTILCLILAQF